MNNRSNYLLSMFSGFAGLVISTALGLVSTPLSLGYWDTERFGLWAIILNLAAYLNVSNFGVSTAAGFLVAKNNDIRDKRLILARSLRILLVSIAICGLALFALFACVPGWTGILGQVPERLLPEARNTVYVVVAFFLAGLPFTLLSGIINGFQRAYVENIFSFLSTIGLFASLVLTIALKGDLVLYATLNGSLGLVLAAARCVYIFRSGIMRQLREARREPSEIPAGDSRYSLLISTSLRFFLIWVAATLVWNTDNFVVSSVIGLSEVTPYSITFKFFNLMFSTIFVLNNSVLPIMGREIGNENWEWITRTYQRLIRIVASFGGLACVGGIAFGHDFILLWTGPKGYAGPLILLFLGLYSYLLSMVNLNSSLLSAFNYTKGLPFFALLEGLVKIGSSILFGKIIGLSGIALGTLLGSLLVPTITGPALLTKRSGNRIGYPLKELVLHFLLCVAPCAGIAIFSQALPNLGLRLALGALVVAIYSFGSLASWGGELRGFARETVAVVVEGLKRKGQRA